MPIELKEKLSLFFKDLFTVDKVEDMKYHKPVCRECEIIGAGFMFTIPFYMWQLVRTGRLGIVSGRVIGALTFCAGMSLLVHPDEKNYKQFKEKQLANKGNELWIQKRVLHPGKSKEE